MKAGIPSLNTATKYHEQQYTDPNSENRPIRKGKADA